MTDWLCMRCDQLALLREGKTVGEMIPEHIRSCPLRDKHSEGEVRAAMRDGRRAKAPVAECGHAIVRSYCALPFGHKGVHFGGTSTGATSALCSEPFPLVPGVVCTRGKGHSGQGWGVPPGMETLHGGYRWWPKEMLYARDDVAQPPVEPCEHDQLMNEVTCAGAARDSRWQCVDCDDGHGNGIWFVFAPEDAVVLSADVVGGIRNMGRAVGQGLEGLVDGDEEMLAFLQDWRALLALLPKP